MKEHPNKAKPLSSEEVKSLLYSTKKTAIPSFKKEPTSLLETKKEKITIKNSFEFNKIKTEYLPYFLMINFLYIYEFQKEGFRPSYKFFKEILLADGVKKKWQISFKEINQTTWEIIDQQSELDEKIKSHLVQWEIKRVSLIKKVILRWGIFFLTENKELPKNRVIPYSINFAKWLGEKKDYKFINGVLNHFYEKDQLCH